MGVVAQGANPIFLGGLLSVIFSFGHLLPSKNFEQTHKARQQGQAAEQGY